jgi:hypothetical protein
MQWLTQNYHNLTIFNIYPNFMHCRENLENNFHWNFVIDDSLCLNPTLGCEINVYMNDVIVQQNIILTCRTLKHPRNSNKKKKKNTFNNKISMKVYTYKRKTINNILPHQSFQFFLRSWNLDKMILKCSSIHYGMIMPMIMFVFTLKNMLFYWRFIWAKCCFNHLKKIKWSFEFFKYGKMMSNKGLRKTLLNHGIWQPSYHQRKRLLNKERIFFKMKKYENKTCLLFAYRHATIVLHQLSWCNKYFHAHIVICKFEKRPLTAYGPLIVVAYYL